MSAASASSRGCGRAQAARSIAIRADMDALPIMEATGPALRQHDRRQDACLRP